MATAYIETTIPSYYVARTSDSLLQVAKQAATRRWWDEGCSGFELPVMCSPDELLQNEDEDD